jgi:hypothetical protein
VSGSEVVKFPASYHLNGFDDGDADAQTGGNVVGSFEDNSALAYGMKIGYRF